MHDEELAGCRGRAIAAGQPDVSEMTGAVNGDVLQRREGAGGQLYSVVGHVSYGLEVVDFIAHRGGKDQRPDGPPLQPVSVLGVAARQIL